MSLSLIKELWTQIKTKDINLDINEDKEHNKSLSTKDFKFISDYLAQKFIEVNNIFSKFNAEDYYTFIENSYFKEYLEKEIIYNKNTKCDSYIFILHGDIDFFDKKEDSDEKILIKTISAGKVYGHLVKENYKYNLIARTNISIIEINKKIFDDFIININKIKNRNKFQFIKKFFPKIRIFSDDIINSVLQYFERVKYNIHSKIILKDEYNEYIYLIIKGQIGFCLRPKLLYNPNDLNNNNDILNKDYIILESLSRGEVFGINSALKNQKNFYTVITLSDNVEVYRISKGNLLFYFGGNNGILPVDLKALGDLQDESCRIKIEYLKKMDINSNKEGNDSLINKFTLTLDESERLVRNKKIKKNENYFIIDEDMIKNNLFEAWKSCENLGNKISEFKSKLLGGKTSNKNENIFEQEEKKDKNSSSSSLKDFSTLKGDATNRVVSRKLNLGLNMNQLKSLDKLNMYSGAKKNGEENIKKLVDINNKLEGGGKNKLMSFMQNEKDSDTLEEFSKKANEKSEKPKRVKNSLKKLRGMDI